VSAVLDLDKKMRMEVYTLNYAMGGALFMECKNRRWRPVVFLLKSLNEIERNYKIHDKEMLVVIKKSWRHLLKGIKFTLLTVMNGRLPLGHVIDHLNGL